MQTKTDAIPTRALDECVRRIRVRKSGPSRPFITLTLSRWHALPAFSANCSRLDYFTQREWSVKERGHSLKKTGLLSDA
jgi:hypothetical protein